MPFSSDEILVLPPRAVPLPVRCQQTFGGVLNQIAWWLLAILTPFVWKFALDCEVLAWPRFTGALGTAQGRITRSIDTHSTEGDPDEGGTPIYENQYTFSLNGTEYSGQSYATGQSLPPGTTVRIDYRISNPNVSRAQDMRAYRFPAAAFLVLIFPCVAVAAIVFGMRKGRKARRLLARGVVTEGVLTPKDEPVRQVGKRIFYEYNYAFTGPDGKAHMTSTLNVDTADDVPESRMQILYDPRDPNLAMPVDDLPAAVRIDDQGCIQPVSHRRALLLMIAPLLTIGGNLLFAAFRFL